MTMAHTTTPQVWIGCLACHNAGRLVGAWFDADEAADVTPADIHRVPGLVVADDGTVYVRQDGPSPHETLRCMDHEGFAGLLKGECSPAEAQRLAELLTKAEEHGPAEAFGAWAANIGATLDDEAPEQFGDAYCGQWDSLADYAQELAGDIAPDHATADLLHGSHWPFSCIDWEHAGNELVMGGDIWTADAGGPDFGVYVFRNI